jgi:hypothetical protein
LRKPFVVIDAEILNSSIWTETAATKLVWFTLLILCDTEGYVGAAVPGLARQAGVSVAECEAALQTFLSPDPHSRTKEHEGRRIEEAERGWRILNFQAVLDRMSSERTKARDRVRKHRERNAMKRADADGNGTIPAENREQRPETRDQGVNGSSVSQSVESEQAVALRKSPEEMPPIDVYGGAIVDEWKRLRGNGLPESSNRDFLQISDWHGSGIPLRVVLRGMTDCIETMRKRGDKPAGKPLAYYNSAVRHAYGQWHKALA